MRKDGNNSLPDSENSKNWQAAMKQLAALPNVFCKLSDLEPDSTTKASDVKPIVDFLIENFGPDRLVFGGDWPVLLAGPGSYDKWASDVRQILSTRPLEVQQKILGGNAIKIYNLTN